MRAIRAAARGQQRARLRRRRRAGAGERVVPDAASSCPAGAGACGCGSAPSAGRGRRSAVTVSAGRSAGRARRLRGRLARGRRRRPAAAPRGDDAEERVCVRNGGDRPDRRRGPTNARAIARGLAATSTATPQPGRVGRQLPGARAAAWWSVSPASAGTALAAAPRDALLGARAACRARALGLLGDRRGRARAGRRAPAAREAAAGPSPRLCALLALRQRGRLER